MCYEFEIEIIRHNPIESLFIILNELQIKNYSQYLSNLKYNNFSKIVNFSISNITYSEAVVLIDIFSCYQYSILRSVFVEKETAIHGLSTSK